MREWNDVNDFMDLERALHKKCNRIRMAGVQGLTASRMRRCVGVLGGLTEVITDTE